MRVYFDSMWVGLVVVCLTTAVLIRLVEWLAHWQNGSCPWCKKPRD